MQVSYRTLWTTVFLQKEFDNIAQTNTKTLLVLLIRDLLMGVLPILALATLPMVL